MKLKSKIKAGGYRWNHNASGVRVKSTVKAGGFRWNHNTSGLRAR